MNLNRQFVLRENEFHQKGKIIVVLKFRATPRYGHFLPRLTKGLSEIWSVRDTAIEARQPGLTDRLWKIVLLREERSKGSSAPDAVMENRLQTKRFGSWRFCSHESGRGLNSREEAVEAAESFVDTLDGGGVREAQVARRAESVARHERDTRLIEQGFGQLGGVFRERAAAAAVGEVRGNVGERVEGASGPLTGHAGNRAQAFDATLAALLVFREHDGNGIHRAAHRFESGVLCDRCRIRCGLALELHGGLNQGFRGERVADTPAGHGEGLGHGADDDDVIL